MNERELNLNYESDFSELRKIIISWKLIPEATNNEFDSLANKILILLYKRPDFEKIQRILTSDLIVTYGLYKSEFDSQRLTENIYE